MYFLEKGEKDGVDTRKDMRREDRKLYQRKSYFCTADVYRYRNRSGDVTG